MAKKAHKNIKLGFSVIALFILSAVFLTAVPIAISLAQTNVSELIGADINSRNLIPQLAKAPKVLTLKINDRGITPPMFSAEGVIVKDLETGQILYQKNPDKKLGPASTTKLLTALVAMEHYKSDDVLQVYSEDMVGGSSMGLNVGDKLTFRSLLYGMLLNSGNDAAFTLASNYPGGLKMFVFQMNKKAIDLGLTASHFQNPAGFDDANHYSSVSDLAKIATVVALDPELGRVVSTKETSVVSYDNNKTYLLKNLNKLLGQAGVMGIKTGYTEKSGENLVGLVDRNNHKVLTVVLNSRNRFSETAALMDWVYGNFMWNYE